MSIINKIGTSLFYSSAGNMAIKALSLISYFIIVNRLAVHDYGIFVLLTTLVGPASAVTFFGFDRIFVSNYAQAKGENNLSKMKGLLKEYFFSCFLLLFLFLLFIYIARDFLITRYDIYLMQYFSLVVFFIISQIFFSFILLFLEANEKFKESSSLQVLESFSRIILVFFLINNLSVESVLLIYSVSKLIAFLGGVIYILFNKVNFFITKDMAEKKVLWGIIKKHGKWEILRNMMDGFIGPFKIWIIKIFISVDGVAVYDLAKNIYSAIIGIFPVKAVLFPIISRLINQREKIQIIVAKAEKYAFIFFTFAYVCSVIILFFGLSYIFPSYSGKLFLIYLILAHLFVESYRIGQSALIYALNQQKFNAQIYPLTLILEITLYITFSIFWGIYGYVFAWHLHVLAIGIIYNYFLRKKFNFQFNFWKEFFNFDLYDKMLLDKITRVFWQHWSLIFKCKYDQK